MKTNLNFLAVALAVLAGVPQLTAQVTLNPNQIKGTVRFTNTNPAILNLLGAPGNLGMINGTIYASSLPPAPPFESDSYFDVPPGLGAPYEMTVQSGNPGIVYSLYPIVGFNQGVNVNGNNGDNYAFNTVDSPPVLSNGPPVTVNLGECLTLLDFKFVNASNVPVPVSGGSISGHIQDGPGQATANSINPGSTNRYFAVRGGTNYNVEIVYQIGTNIYGNQIQFELATNITTLCDQIMPIQCVVPAAGSFGQITGVVSLAGEFLLRTGGYPPAPERTVVEAYNGPFGNTRWTTVPGANFTVPSSGPYALTNLPASASASPAQGYSVHAEMEFRTNFQYTWLRTPGLGEGANPPVLVTGGGIANLSNTFAITPGYIDGSVLLQGPAENGVTNSVFRGVLRSIQEDPSPDGIPHAVSADYGNFYSIMEVLGVNQLAPGATLTAVNGECLPSVQGNFNPIDSAFEGSYEAVVGGLNSQNSLWKPSRLQLLLVDPSYVQDSTNGSGNYYDGYVEVTDQRTNVIEVVAGQHYTNNVAYCFSDVQIGFKTTSGTFFQPLINTPSSGSFIGTDFQGKAVNYQVSVFDTYGTPVSASAATNSGLLRMALPQGIYNLYPYVQVTNSDGSQSRTALPPITNLAVGCLQRIFLEQCLQISQLNLPACATNRLVPLSGLVTGCTNVSLITCQLNGGPTNVVCTNCGANPGFIYLLNLAGVGACSTNSVVITAYDVNGNVSSITSQIQFNDVPPVVLCPPDLVIPCVNTNQVPVTFNVSATSNCGGPVIVVCNPPSGSLFPAGTNTVTCYAVDGCGNQSLPCTFHVIVLSQLVSIQSAIMVTWGCGILQSAGNINGPWSDVPGATSPYYAPAGHAMTFYRTRQ